MPAHAQVVPTVTAPTTISPSSANVLNLLAPYLSLNATSVGQATLTTSLSQAVAINNGASLTLQQMGESDENLPGGISNSITLANGTKMIIGNAANLGGGLPAQATPAGGTVVPVQPVGGLGAVLGNAYYNGINTGIAGTGAAATNTGPLSSVATLLNNAYTNFTSPNLGVAKNYFANGGASSTVTYAADQKTVVTATTSPAVAPTGYTLPTFNGLPNTTTSVYDTAYGVTNRQAGQDVFGSSRPDQVSTQINSFDPTALNQLAGNPSFPSGHTTYAYTDSILLAMLVPQEYQSMLYRGSAYANSRIVVGVHYPIDIIGSRSLAQYDLAQALTNPLYINNATTTGGAGVNLPANFTAAQAQLTPYLTTAATTAGCGTSVATCATNALNTANDPYTVTAANAALYTSNLTYGLPTLTFAQAPREAAPTGGPDASILLAPIFGGSTSAAATIAPNGGTVGTLSTATINQIIVNTETTALAAFYGTSLSYWSRIDLASAAGYFGNVIGTTSLASTDVVNTPVTIGAGGVLDANGTVNGATTVTSTGTLTGSGTINGAVTVNAGATLAPGSLAAQTAMAAGTAGVTGTNLAINGAVNFGAGSTLSIFATPTQVTSAVATGTATLTGATVNVTLPTSGTFVTSQNNLIFSAAGGLTGTFSGVTSNLLFATPTLSYDPNTNVFLSFGTPNFSVVATTSNERAVANGLNHGAALNTASPVANALEFFTAGQAAQAKGILDSLSGEGITAAQNAAHASSQMFTDAIFDQTTFYGAGGGNQMTLTERAPGSGFFALAPTQYTDGRPGTNGSAPIRELADLPSTRAAPVPPAFAPVRTWRIWGSGFGGTDDIHGNDALGTAAQNDTIYGGTVGIDYQITPNYLAGIAVGGSDGEFSVPNRSTSGSTTGGHVAFYDLATFGNGFYGASTTSASFYQNRTTRNVAGFGGLASETEKGSFFSDEFRSRLEVGRTFVGALGLGSVGSVTPFLALEIAELRSNGFGETAIGGPGNFALNVSGQSTADVPAFVGARFTRVTTLGNGMVFSPTLQLAYVHEFAPYRSQFAAIASLPGSTFLVDGARPSRDSAQVKVGGELAIGPHSVLFANFNGEFSGAEQLYAGKGGFKYSF